MWEKFKRGFTNFLDFCNCLDDASKKLSPVKINVWGSNIGVYSTFIAAFFKWLGHNIDGIEQIAGMAFTWATSAHAWHHFDKRERNIAEARLVKAGEKADG